MEKHIVCKNLTYNVATAVVMRNSIGVVFRGARDAYEIPSKREWAQRHYKFATKHKPSVHNPLSIGHVKC